MQNKLQKNITYIIIGALCVSPVLYFEAKGHRDPSKYGTSYAFFWGVVNLLTIFSFSELNKNYGKILKLKGLEVNKWPMIMHQGIILLFFVFANLYFVNVVYQVNFLSFLTNPYLYIGVVVLFFISTSFGRMIEVHENNGLAVYTLRDAKLGIMGGSERLGTNVGTYDEGIVVSTAFFPYDSIRTVQESKGGTLIIKGETDAGKYVVNVMPKKGKEKLKEIFREKKDGPLKNKGIKFK